MWLRLQTTCYHLESPEYFMVIVISSVMDSTHPSFTFQRKDVQEILRDIDLNGQALLSGQEAVRTSLIDKARSLIASLETPIETVTWIAWAEVNTYLIRPNMFPYESVLIKSAYKASYVTNRH